MFFRLLATAFIKDETKRMKIYACSALADFSKSHFFIPTLVRLREDLKPE
jgi:hypothetical protein